MNAARKETESPQGSSVRRAHKENVLQNLFRENNIVQELQLESVKQKCLLLTLRKHHENNNNNKISNKHKSPFASS